MLPKKKRVTKESFRVLMKEGKILSTPLFLFYSTESELPQYVFVAPKSSFKNAVKRNKFRRLGYNIIRTLPLKTGSGVFVFKKPALTAKQQEIKENISFILKKAGFIK